MDALSLTRRESPWVLAVLTLGRGMCSVPGKPVFAAATGAGAESSGAGSLRHSLALQIRQIKDIIFPPSQCRAHD